MDYTVGKDYLRGSGEVGKDYSCWSSNGLNCLYTVTVKGDCCRTVIITVYKRDDRYAVQDYYGLATVGSGFGPRMACAGLAIALSNFMDYT
jgi:hypothetical protein